MVASIGSAVVFGQGEGYFKRDIRLFSLGLCAFAQAASHARTLYWSVRQRRSRGQSFRGGAAAGEAALVLSVSTEEASKSCLPPPAIGNVSAGQERR
jgi:hypothetical protein